MCRKAFNALLCRHLRSSFHSRNDQGLRDIRKCVLQIQRSRCTEARTHPRTALICDSKCIKFIHLLPDGAIHTRIPGMQPDEFLSLCMCFFHHINDFIQRHLRAVVYFTSFLRIFQKLRVYQRSRINDHIRFLKQTHSTHRDQVCGSASRSNKVNHRSASLLFASSPNVLSYMIQSICILPPARLFR